MSTSDFTFLTPIIGSVFGAGLTLNASATAPILNPLVAQIISDPTTPVAEFSVAVSPASRDAPAVVSFTNTSANATSFSWDFGDGTTSTLQDPPDHVYALPGTYKIVLTVSDGAVTATTSHTVTVNMPAGPLADFTFTPEAGTLTVSFKDTSPGTITAWLWDFGDGTTDSTETTIQNPSHTYSARGTYNVTLTVTDDADLTASITRSVTVDDTPPPTCVVPDLYHTYFADISSRLVWQTAGFTGTLTDSTGGHLIQYQDLPAGSSQPCTANMTVSDHKP